SRTRSSVIAASAEAAITEDRVRDTLLTLIADRTGYPPEMLEGALNLEADLGIDSIKRVEILGALRTDLLPHAGEAAQAKMGPVSREKTVPGIVARFMEVAAEFSRGGRDAKPTAGEVTGEADPEPEPGGPGFADWPARFQMIAQPVSAPPVAEWVRNGAAYVLTPDAEGVAARLADLIAAQGGVPVLIAPETLTDPAALRAAVAPHRDSVAGILHCAPLSAAPDVAVLSQADWDRSVEVATGAFFHLLSELGPDLSARKDAVILCATAMGGAFGFDMAAQAPAAGGPPGLLKTLSKEWTGAHCRAVDFGDTADAETRARTLFAEAGRRDGMVEIGYRDGQRLGLFAQLRPLAAAKDAALPGKDAVVLVTGGARGITARAVRRLAASTPCRFVLVGSSPLPRAEGPETAGITDMRALKSALIAAAKAEGRAMTPAAIEADYRALTKAREIHETLAAVQGAGAAVSYESCDVTDPDALSALVARVRGEHGRIDAVIHGAGIIEDKLILDKSPDSFARVMGTKTRSAFALARALNPDEVGTLVFFTSVAGRFGNRGQGDYGAANETVAKLASHLNARWPGRVLAVSWGPWDSGGMVSDEVRGQFAEMGIEPIPPHLGVEALAAEIAAPPGEPAEIVWGRGPWENDLAPGTSEAAQ
ncbi:SDR family NAD(P)-dependent oxidoreductase, partial [Rhodovulum adriaticum]|uniref:SDR family NAD(P)-dependent oxidoreductase n=1 Tax=Rhodovulum adriaticum TaxID=35804 RepID=UPI001907FDC1